MIMMTEFGVWSLEFNSQIKKVRYLMALISSGAPASTWRRYVGQLSFIISTTASSQCHRQAVKGSLSIQGKAQWQVLPECHNGRTFFWINYCARGLCGPHFLQLHGSVYWHDPLFLYVLLQMSCAIQFLRSFRSHTFETKKSCCFQG